MDPNSQASAHGFIAWLKSSPLGRQYTEADQAQKRAEAKAKAGERSAMMKAHSARFTKLVKARDEAAEAFALKGRELATAREALGAATLAVQALTHQYDREMAALEHRLRELASPKLHAEIEHLLAQRDGMRDLRIHEEARGGKSWDGFARGPFFSSRSSLEAHLKYLIEADATIRAWMLEALEEEEVDARIAKLRAEIPDPNLMVEVESLR